MTYHRLHFGNRQWVLHNPAGEPCICWRTPAIGNNIHYCSDVCPMFSMVEPDMEAEKPTTVITIKCSPKPEPEIFDCDVAKPFKSSLPDADDDEVETLRMKMEREIKKRT